MANTIKMEDIKIKIQNTFQMVVEYSQTKIRGITSNSTSSPHDVVIISNNNTASEHHRRYQGSASVRSENSRLDVNVDDFEEIEEIETQISSHGSRHIKQNTVTFHRQLAREDVNGDYCRTRRYDTAGKYRIGPTFITKTKLGYMDKNKPGKLSVKPDDNNGNKEFGLLTYLWTFTDQHDKTEIDLRFLKSLVDSGVNINSRDEHGKIFSSLCNR